MIIKEINDKKHREFRRTIIILIVIKILFPYDENQLHIHIIHTQKMNIF